MSIESKLYEERNRAAKVAKLVAMVDECDYFPSDACGVVTTLNNLTDEGWDQLSKLAKVNPPSHQTKQMVIRHYELKHEAIEKLISAENARRGIR